MPGVDEGRKRVILIAASILAGTKAGAVCWRWPRACHHLRHIRCNHAGGTDTTGNRQTVASEV